MVQSRTGRTLWQHEIDKVLGRLFSRASRRSVLPTSMKRRKTNGVAANFVGVDIGKRWLDVATAQAAFRVPNTAGGFAKLARLSRRPGHHSHFVCEPGSYGRELVRFFHSKKLTVSIVSAYKVRQFGKARGQAAKTDKIDAHLLSTFGQIFRPEPTAKPHPAEEKLRRVVRRRQQIIEAVKVQKHHLETMEGATLVRDAKVLVKTLVDYGRQLEKTAIAQVAKIPKLLRRFTALTSVDGVGSISALQLMSEVPELGDVSRREIASLVGLAPLNHDSGIKTGHRSIRGGRTLARTALYMAAFHASRVNPVLAPFYKRLRVRGKPYRVALVAVMRKLLVHLNSVVRSALVRASRRKRLTA